VENCSYPSSEERIRSHGGKAGYSSNPPASRTYEPYLLTHKIKLREDSLNMKDWSMDNKESKFISVNDQDVPFSVFFMWKDEMITITLTKGEDIFKLAKAYENLLKNQGIPYTVKKEGIK